MKKPVKVIPLGPPLDTDAAALDMAALITPEDIEAAKADAARNTTRRGAAMLETAKTPKDEDEPTG